MALVPDGRSDAPSFEVTEPTERSYVRSPVPAIRLVAVLVVLGVMSFVLRRGRHAAFASSFAALLGRAPPWLVSGIVGACQIVVLLPVALGVLGQIALRHRTRVVRLLLAAVVCIAGLVAMSKLVGRANLALLPPRHPRGGHAPAVVGVGRAYSGYGIGAAFPTALDLGLISAWMAIDSAHWATRWRRLGRVVLLLAIIARLGVGFAEPAAIITSIAMGVAAARLVETILGVRNARARAATVGAVLERLGFSLASIEQAEGFRGFVGFRARLDAGALLFVKVVSRDSWSTRLPIRMYRSARFRDMGAEQPFRTLRSRVEHEALCALKAYSDGVPTARLIAVTEYPPDGMLIAFRTSRFRPLAQVPPGDRSPELLASVWEIVSALQRSHIVHHHLNAESLMVDEEGRVVLVDFASASIGVVDAALSSDIAEVLVATTARLGVEQAVRAAVEGVGAPALAAALPRLQPLALTPPTRSAIKVSGNLDALRDEVVRVTGADLVPIADLERIKARSIAAVAMVTVAIGAIVPQLVGFGSVWGELQHANWWWAAVAIGFSAITYIGAAIALDGSIPDRLPFVPNIGVQVATSFVGVVAPGGGLALTARFLQKRGIDTGTAAAAVGVDTLAGVIVHLTLTGLFVALAGSSGLTTFHLPSLTTIGLVVLGVLALAGTSLAIRWSRRLLVNRVLPATRRSVLGVAEIARQPTKMVSLFGGSLAITLGYILALEAAIAAFGPGPAFTSVALVYLVSAVASSVAPTPGGIGAVEATLIAGLTSAGMPGATALAAVILFRLTTFWLPLLPGWGALTIMQRTGDL